MKKLLIILLASTSIVYANGNVDCSKEAQNIASRLNARHKNSITINYSSDMAPKARACRNDLATQFKVNMHEENGSNIFKLSK